MEIINGSVADLTAGQALDAAGHPYLVVIAKASFTLQPGPQAILAPAEQRRGLLISDLHEGEPGVSAPLIESDFVPTKAACDVVVKGSAHAPGGRPVESFAAGVAIGSMRKMLRVVGERRWHKRLIGGYQASSPGLVAAVAVTYGRAFGGMYDHSAIGGDDPTVFLAHPENFVGCGYFRGPFLRLADGSPLPQFEVIGAPVVAPGNLHKPAGLGPIGRGWAPRRGFGGTYDERWREQVFPLLPEDFDERYYQCAPQDQQIPFPRGGETVSLWNMTPGGGMTQFTLPPLDLPMAVISRDRRPLRLAPVVDTIVIDTDAGNVDIVWRARSPLRRDLHEILTVAAGKVCKRWWSSRVLGTDDCGCAGKETEDEDLVPVSEAVS